MIKKIFKHKFLIFTLLVFVTIGGASFLNSQIHAAEDQEEWDEHKDELTSEGLNKHATNDFIFSTKDVMMEEEKEENGDVSYTGALPSVTNAIGSIYANPPASGVYYAYDILHNLGAKTAYAQGTGFSGLQPILPIWKAFRNITYVFFALISIGVGVAIMLRVKISPQAVISISNALPKIIGALILVTFSYAIAGFLIDLMYVSIALSINILKQQGIDFGITSSKIINSGVYQFTPIIFPNAAGLTVTGMTIGGILGGLIMPIPYLEEVTGVMGLAAGGALIWIIWMIIALILFFKLLFELIKAYIKIILSIILAPLQIMVGAIPGMQAGGFGRWFKGLLAEILIFPAVAVVSMIGTFIIKQVGTTGQEIWVAPFIQFPHLTPKWTGDITKAISQLATNASPMTLFTQTIIGTGFLLILPNIPNLIRSAFQIESPFGSMIGQAIRPGMATAAWPFQQTIGQYQEASRRAVAEQQGEQMESQQGNLIGRNAAAMARGIPVLGGLFRNKYRDSENGKD